MAKTMRLGKGINALIPQYDENTTNEERIEQISIYDIDPNENQPRQNFDENNMGKLAESIKQHGILQPLILMPFKGRYRIVVGERRWRAAKALGIETIPAIIKELNKRDEMEIAIIENLQREDLNPVEEANALKTLIEEFQLTQDELAERIGKSRSAIANTLRLLTLDEQIKTYLKDGKITSGHARALLSIEDKKLQKEIVERILEKDLSVRDIETLVKRLKDKKGRNKHSKKRLQSLDPVTNEIENNIQNTLGTKVRIIKGKKTSKIEIEFYNNEDLERIYEMLISVK